MGMSLIKCETYVDNNVDGDDDLDAKIVMMMMMMIVFNVTFELRQKKSLRMRRLYQRLCLPSFTLSRPTVFTCFNASCFTCF